MPYLSDLLATTRARVDEARAKITEDALEQRVASAEPARGFARSLRGDEVAVIAEIKRATPRAGDLALDLDAGRTASLYRDGGAAAISVLTEPEYFKGSLEDLDAARGPGLPVLRKDFILEPFQIYESRGYGADAVLLIVRTVGPELAELYTLTRALGMDALVEVHTEEDLDRALELGPDLIGVNHRDLETFELDPDRTAKLTPRIPDGVVVVGLSGVSTRAEVLALKDAGAHAVLVGESVVTATDPVTKLKELRGA
ncbi:MAG TPA: indole-3-glycerol phosphate synthase TrpC [Actinomycetota bacterium]|nr:indole-3-glycerol phosphate synthase TrpC [Actinomycetota bacterium]